MTRPDAQVSLFDSSVRCPARSVTACINRPGSTCGCKLLQDHLARHVCVECGQVMTSVQTSESAAMLFGPPSGSEVAPYTDVEGSPEAYRAFMAGVVGHELWTDLLAAAQAVYHGAYHGTAKRFSTRTFIAKYRERYGLRINDHFSPWLADALVASDVRLDTIVERRRRAQQ